MARPKPDPNVVNCRMTPEVRQKAEQLAAWHGLTLKEFCESCIFGETNRGYRHWQAAQAFAAFKARHESAG